MNNYNNNYIQKRNAEKGFKMLGKDIAETEHYKETKNAAKIVAKEIASRFGLSEITEKNLASLMFSNEETKTELLKKAYFVNGLLINYGYTENEVADIINSNFSLINQPSIKLVHNLSIANFYGFDRYFLVNNAKFSNINEKELHALIEELKEKGSKITPENILKLNIKTKFNNGMSELVEKHHLEKRTLYIYRTLYERNMNYKKDKDKTLTK